MTSEPTNDRPEIQFHDEIADRWEALHRSRAFRRRTKSMFQLLDGSELSGQAWIDAGCGTGTLSRLLAERGCEVLGFDASQEMIGVASRATISSPRSNICTFRLIDSIERLPLADQSCDGILCASVLEYTPAPERCLAEFARVLRPDGMLLLSIPNQRSWMRQFFKGAYALSSLLVSRPAFRYLQHSRFEASAIAAAELLQRHGFLMIGHGFAGSPFPANLDRTSRIGTLINILARRQDTDPVSVRSS